MKFTKTKIATVIGVAALGAGGVTTAQASSTTSSHQISFALQRSTASVTIGCLTTAGATVKVVNKGPVEEMTINAHGLPKNTDFDVFITQLPNAPFGISWYQGDLESNGQGKAHVKFVGRFSVETFAVAPGSGAAPRRARLRADHRRIDQPGVPAGPHVPRRRVVQLGRRRGCGRLRERDHTVQR